MQSSPAWVSGLTTGCAGDCGKKAPGWFAHHTRSPCRHTPCLFLSFCVSCHGSFCSPLLRTVCLHPKWEYRRKVMHIWKAWSRVACGAKCSGELLATCQRTCRKLPFNTASSALWRPRTVLCYLSSHAANQWETSNLEVNDRYLCTRSRTWYFKRWMVGYPPTVGCFWGLFKLQGSSAIPLCLLFGFWFTTAASLRVKRFNYRVKLETRAVFSPTIPVIVTHFCGTSWVKLHPKTVEKQATAQLPSLLIVMQSPR